MVCKKIGGSMLKVKVTPIGNSLGILIPKEALSKLKAGRGDTLYLVESPDGYTLTPYQQDFEEQVDAASKLMKRYKNTLRELAK
jgi:putative addiction module antidote